MAGLGDLMGMMRDFGTLRQRLQAAQDELARKTVTGEAGGGMVRATVNGRQELLDLHIDPDIVNRDDVALLEELIKGAVGQAMAKAKDVQREAVTGLLGGMPLPPGLDALLS